MKLKPVLSLRRPNVSARSEKSGPKVDDVRFQARWVASKVNVNPPDEEPSGAVATSSAMACASISPVAALPAMNVAVRSWARAEPAAVQSRTVPSRTNERHSSGLVCAGALPACSQRRGSQQRADNRWRRYIPLYIR